MSKMAGNPVPRTHFDLRGRDLVAKIDGYGTTVGEPATQPDIDSVGRHVGDL